MLTTSVRIGFYNVFLAFIGRSGSNSGVFYIE